MKISIKVLLVLFVMSNYAFSQNNNSELPSSINDSGTPPAPDAMLDVQSTDKGILIPRMSTTQRLAINGGSPSEGLLVFDTDENNYWFYNGVEWINLSDSLWTSKFNGMQSDSSIVSINTAPFNQNRFLVDSGIDWFGPNKATISVNRNGVTLDPNGGGVGWSSGFVDVGIKSYNFWGNRYSGAIMGYTYHDYGEVAAVGGADQSGNNAGFLSYQEDDGNGGPGDVYSGYFTDDVKILGGLKLNSLSGTGTRNLVVEADGTVGFDDNAINYISYPASNYFLTNDCLMVWSDVTMYGTSGCTTGQVRMPLNLPHGATLTDITVNYYDNSSNDFIYGIFRSEKTTNNFSAVLPYVTFPDIAGNGSSSTGSINHLVDNENYTYIVIITRDFGNTWDGIDFRVGDIFLEYTP